MKRLAWLLTLALLVSSIGFTSYALTGNQTTDADGVSAASKRQQHTPVDGRRDETPNKYAKHNLTVEQIPTWYNDSVSWTKAFVADMVTAGTLTQAQADAVIARLDADLAEFKANGFPVLMRAHHKLRRLIAKSGVEVSEIPAWYTASVTWRKAQIAAFVSSGDLTETQATAINERIDKHVDYLQEHGFGVAGPHDGRGPRGGGRGHRGFGDKPRAPKADDASDEKDD